MASTNGDSALGLASLRCNPESVARTNGDSAIGGSPETWWTQPMAFTASSTADLDYAADKGAKWTSPDKLQLPPDLPSLECIQIFSSGAVFPAMQHHVWQGLGQMSQLRSCSSPSSLQTQLVRVSAGRLQ